MAIHDEEVVEVSGFEKTIEASATNLMMNILQNHQYQYPHKSTIRELVSNAIDAVKERDVAIKILKGEARVEDFFVEKEGEIYEDSKFNPAYYSLDWINPEGAFPDPNKVYITYHEGSATEKDFITIEDYGVGLGGRRLQGYFNLGYSSKRLNRHTLGKFGIGAKAALSTVDYYTMVTRYNGREYRFNIYTGKVQSIVPKLNMETGKTNGVHVFDNGAIIYYIPTEERNGTVIQIAAKKHHKALYLDAVKSQLLYFDNVQLQLKTAGGTQVIPIQAKILFEDDALILSDNTQFQKPHMLINRVNYGLIDFMELELEDMRGNIGVKIEAEEVDVNPSRESVVWSEKTKHTVVKAFKNVQEAAGKLVQEKLKTDDFMEWVKSCAQMSNFWQDQNSVLGRLAKIVDIDKADIYFNNDKRVLWGSWLFAGFNIRSVELKTEREGSKIKYKLSRHPVSPREMASRPIYISNGPVSFKRDKYLCQMHPEGFILFERPFQVDRDPDGNPLTTIEEARRVVSVQMREYLELVNKKSKVLTAEQLATMMEHIMSLVDASKHKPADYDSVTVPEGFNSAEEIEEEVTVESKAAKLHRQRAEGVIPIHTPRSVDNPWVHSGVPDQSGRVKIYEWQMLNMPTADIDKWDDDEVYYGNDADADAIRIAAFLTRPKEMIGGPISVDRKTDVQTYGAHYWGADRCCHFFEKPTVKLIKVSKDRVKLFQDFKHINKFFSDVKGKTLTMSDSLIRWNTARLINQGIGKLRFLQNFKVISPVKSAQYEQLREYVDKHHRSAVDHFSHGKYQSLQNEPYQDLTTHLDKVFELQKFVRANAQSPELIAKFVTEMFNPPVEINDGKAVDLPLVDQFNDLMDWAAPVQELFNNMKAFDAVGTHLPDSLVTEVLAYMEAKSVKP